MVKVSKTFFVLVAVGLLSCLVIAWLLFGRHSIIPKQIQAQLTSTVFLPQGDNLNTSSRTVKYDKSLRLLSFRTQIYDVTAVTVSEQPSPDAFVDIPGYQDKFFQAIGGYKTFETTVGVVHLVKDPKNGQQAAAMSTKGTLLFVKPDKELSEDQWRAFFLRVKAE